MTLFLYKLKNDEGRVFWGVANAKNLKDLKKFLREKNSFYFISAENFSLEKLHKLKLSLDDLIMFTNRLSYLIESGVSIIESLNILWKQSEKKEVQIIVSHMRKKLEDGANLQEAFNEFKNVFPPMYLALISVAEVGAGLVKILKKLSAYLEDQKKFHVRIQKATTYPLFVLSFAFLVVVGMFLFVVPTFKKVIVKLKADLPVITKLIFGLSDLIHNPLFLIFMALLIVFTIMAIKFFKRNDKFLFWFDSWKLKAPLLKNVIYPLTIGRFTRSLGLLVESGVPLLTSIDVARKTIINKRIEIALDQIKRKIVEGDTLYEAFNSAKVFPMILVDMMGIGESSGKLQQILENVANHLEEEADFALTKFFTYLEPALIIMVGGIVLTVMLAIYLPIFSIQNALRTM